MSSKYKPAIFQPTVRPSWAGILSYINIKEKSYILEAIIRFPEKTEIKSKFWEETILHDLEEQYKRFLETCESRGRGAKTYWGEHKLYISNTCDNHKDNSLKDKDKNKDKDKDKNKDNIQNQVALVSPVMPAMEKWVAYKKERGQSYKPTGFNACLEKLERLSNNDLNVALQIVNESISNNWAGLFPLKNKTKAQTVDEKNWEIIKDTFDLGG